MVENDKISVLMAVYKNDNPLHFHQAVKSIINQTFPASEIVLVVDGPISESIEQVISELQEECSYLCVYRLEENVGLGAALNYGMTKCTYEIVARMDSDDISVPDRLEKQISYFKNNEKLSIVGSYIDEFVENPMEPVSIRAVPLSNAEIRKKAVIRSPFNHPSVMYKKKDVINAGGYQSLYIYEDYYLWIRMIEQHCICANIPEVLVHMRVGNGMLERRAGKEGFQSNKFLQNYMLKHKMISIWKYVFNIIVRWSVQVGMPSWMQKCVYQSILRKK